MNLLVSDINRGMSRMVQLPCYAALASLRARQLSVESYSVQKREESEEYTHIIVGAGSAGCVLANRLSAQPSNKVLLLEAGNGDSSWKIQMPAALLMSRDDRRFNWCYHTVPQRHMNNRKISWPRGKVLGGSSSINAMVYARGHADDYDRWVREGAVGWSYADCLPYFKRSQCHELGENEYRGGDGPLHVSKGKSNNPLFTAFIRAGEQCGYRHTSDMNGYQQEGFGYIDMTIHEGKRWSTANAYLRADEIQQRKNLTIRSRSFAQRILFEGPKAVGIEYTRDGTTNIGRATHEVILSGGSINSPSLLMLSGIGNADELKKLGIPVVIHLPGVGRNLQDHVHLPIRYGCPNPATNWPISLQTIGIGLEWFIFKTGLGTTPRIEAGAFVRSRPELTQPDIQLCCVASMTRPQDFEIHVNTLRETSRGTVKLKSRDPKEHPLIDPEYLDSETDRMNLRAAIKVTRDVVAQAALDQFRGEEIMPGPSVQSDSDLDAYIREFAGSNFHPCGTCKMGSAEDRMAVVDNTTRVLGLDNLRVVDSSVMPSNVSGNINAPTIMIAERAADMILGNDPLPRVTVPVWKPSSGENHMTKEPKDKLSVRLSV